jgi:hypothetical protein
MTAVAKATLQYSSALFRLCLRKLEVIVQMFMGFITKILKAELQSSNDYSFS